ncbi:MAG: 16S rRNA (cytosine(1402)-N(4))-methyltransferase RsmH [Prolixibacteraceae bacterium]|nr:16S rRNA (cytosine(1402)-N(4))-methyltransferase RsmH [Prolixibacteraceae bacterium]
METAYHIPVLLDESIEGLAIKPGGIYVDVTYGGGGHSKKILEQLTTGKLIAFDQDVDAAHNVVADDRLLFVQHNFKYLKNFLDYYGYPKVDGVLADLGVSSHDFDVAERGFSFRFSAQLDMRMNQTGSLTAARVVNEYDEARLIQLFREFGELPNARRIARVLVESRSVKPMVSTTDLKELLEPLVPQNQQNKFMAKVFQALRIEVNQELEVLKTLLNDVYEVLKPGGRLVVISYHSLEDRLVKNMIQRGNFDGEQIRDFYGNVAEKFRPVGKKLIVPGAGEMERNPRARSAKMRIAERV